MAGFVITLIIKEAHPVEIKKDEGTVGPSLGQLLDIMIQQYIDNECEVRDVTLELTDKDWNSITTNHSAMRRKAR